MAKALFAVINSLDVDQAMKRYLMAAAAALFLAGAVGSTVASQDKAADQRRPANPQQDVRNFLAAKGRQQEAAIAQLLAAGVPYGQMRSIVARYSSLLRSNKLVSDAGLAPEVNEAFLTDIAIELAVLGYGPQDLRDPTTARALFLAAAAKRRAAASSEQLMQLAQNVVVARVDGYAMLEPNGASAAEMRVTAIRSLKGDIAANAPVRVQLRTRRNADRTVTRPTDEYLPPIGSEVLLLLSASAARFQGRSTTAVEGSFVKITEPYRVQDGTALPVMESAGPVSIAQ